MNLLVPTDRGLHCPAGGFFIDPTRPVERAVVTHAHSDHATPGCRRYLTSDLGAPLVRLRVGQQARIDSLPYGRSQTISGVRVSLHPSGHLLGASQVRLEYRGQVWVVTGDYKRQADPSCLPFEPLRCHTFITETTFGLPIYRWPSPSHEIAALQRWWQDNRRHGITSVISAYALGKAQRILASLSPHLGPIVVHESIAAFNRLYRAAGVALPGTLDPESLPRSLENDPPLILTIGSSMTTPWMRRFGRCRIAAASGWLRTRHSQRYRGLDRGFVLSDHVDWPDLLTTIQETQAERVWLMHGFTESVSRFLESQGLETRIVDRTSLPLAQQQTESPPPAASAAWNATPCELEPHQLELTPTIPAPRRHPSSGLLGPFIEWIDQTGEPERDLLQLRDLLDLADAAEATAILSLLLGARPRRITTVEQLAELVRLEHAIPEWLWQRCLDAAGDLVETIATVDDESHDIVQGSVAETLRTLELLTSEPPSSPTSHWKTLTQETNRATRVCLARWWTGTWRSPVSRTIVFEALALRFQLPVSVVADRALKTPLDSLWTRCADPCTPQEQASLPAPFVETRDAWPPVAGPPAATPSPTFALSADDWILEPWWHGVRIQVIRTPDEVILRPDSPVRLERRLPELRASLMSLPSGTVLEGIITPWLQGQPLSDRTLQARLARQRCNAKDAIETPLKFFVYDLLRDSESLWLEQPLAQRRAGLQQLFHSLSWQDSETIQLLPSHIADPQSLDALLADAKRAGAKGLIAKRLTESRSGNSPHAPPLWYRYRVASETLFAVLVHHRPASPNDLGEWTLALRDSQRWVPVARVPGGWSDSQERELEQWIREATLVKHGPVRTVSANQVLEIQYDRLEPSRRHSCGFVLRQARVVAWRPDLSPDDTLPLSILRQAHLKSRGESPESTP